MEKCQSLWGVYLLVTSPAPITQQLSQLKSLAWPHQKVQRLVNSMLRPPTTRIIGKFVKFTLSCLWSGSHATDSMHIFNWHHVRSVPPTDHVHYNGDVAFKLAIPKFTVCIATFVQSYISSFNRFVCPACDYEIFLRGGFHILFIGHCEGSWTNSTFHIQFTIICIVRGLDK